MNKNTILNSNVTNDNEGTSVANEIEVAVVEEPTQNLDDSHSLVNHVSKKPSSSWKMKIKDSIQKGKSTYAKRPVFSNIILSLHLLIAVVMFSVAFVFLELAIVANPQSIFIYIPCLIIYLFFLLHTFQFVVLNLREAVVKSFIDLFLALFPLIFAFIVLETAEPEEGNDNTLLIVCILDVVTIVLIAGIIICALKRKKYGATAWTLMDVPRSDSRRGINFRRIGKVCMVCVGMVVFGFIGHLLLLVIAPLDKSSNAYKSAEDVHIGDYYYEDGTISSKLLSDKKCVGIVYSLETSDFEKSEGFTHGHIVAIEDASKEKNEWDRLNEDKDWIPNYTWENRREALSDKSGYYYCNMPYIDVFRPCLDANKAIGTSFWYVPTAGEWTEILKNLGHTEVSDMLTFDAETASENLGTINIDNRKWYWVMAEQDDKHAWSIRIASGEFGSRTPKTNKAYVRPVAVF